MQGVFARRSRWTSAFLACAVFLAGRMTAHAQQVATPAASLPAAVQAQQAATPAPSPVGTVKGQQVVTPPAPASVPAAAPAPSPQDLLLQMQQMRKEIEELKRQRNQSFTGAAPTRNVSYQANRPGPASPNPAVPMLPSAVTQYNQAPATGDMPAIQGTASGEDTADPQAGLPAGEGPAVPGSGDDFPMKISYRYNSGGGYTSVSSEDGNFSINLQNLVALDGTFFNKASINTPEKGFVTVHYPASRFGVGMPLR